MKFFKIKYNGEKVALSWTEHKLGGTEIEHNLHSGQTPAPDLPAALKKFERFVEELLEVPADWMNTLKVTGLSINEEEDDGREGLVITCQKKLASTNGPLVVNTPHLREPVKLGEEGPGFFLDGMAEAIETANNAACRVSARRRICSKCRARSDRAEGSVRRCAVRIVAFTSA
jgi:hypothetical protein